MNERISMTDKSPSHFFISVLCLAIFSATAFLPSISRCDESEIKIGVLAYSGKEAATKMWSETANYLTEKIPRSHFTIVPLDFNEIGPAVNRGAVDFVITNPEIYVDLEAQYGVAGIATLNIVETSKVIEKITALNASVGSVFKALAESLDYERLLILSEDGKTESEENK